MLFLSLSLIRFPIFIWSGHMRIFVWQRRMPAKTCSYGGRITSTFGKNFIGTIAQRGNGQSYQDGHSRTVFWCKYNCSREPMRTIHYWRSNGKAENKISPRVNCEWHFCFISQTTIGRRWLNGTKDHRRHIWWLGCTRWWRIFGQRFHKSWPFSSLCSTLGGQIIG